MSAQVVEKLRRNINKEYVNKFPLNVLKEEQFIPISVQGNVLFVGVVDAKNTSKLERIKQKVKDTLDVGIKSLPITLDHFNELISDFDEESVDIAVPVEQSITESEPSSPAFQKPVYQPGQPKKRLGDILCDAGLITQEQLMNALAESKKYGDPLGSTLVKLDYLSVEQLADALSAQQGIEHVEASQLNIDKQVMGLLPEDFVKSNKVVPISTDGKNLTVAMVNPSDKTALNEIIYMTGLMPCPKLITHVEYKNCIEKYFKAFKRTEKIIAAVSEEGTSAGQTLWEMVEKELQDNSSAVAKFANQIITDAIDLKASDIHIEPRFGKYIVRYRIDGILKKVLDIPEKIESSIISRFKVISRMNIAEHRRAQDGTFSLKHRSIPFDFRINTLPVGNKEKMVIRILQPSVSISSDDTEINIVGAANEEIEKIKLMTSAPNGIILTSGPTGSGKTTTLYSVLKTLNDESVNITTVEDPIEIRLDGVNQTQVNPKADITFANCMRAILRQDPDIILVGEIRDYETLEVAISAALTGHLVLSTIHTNSAAATITRLIEMGAQDYLIASSIEGVIAQRLVRKLCSLCKEKYTPSLKEARMVIAQPEDIEKFTKTEIYKPVGCEKCNYNGYVGRIGVYEVMQINREIKKLIAQSAPDVEIEEVAVSCGMKTLNQACLAHILNGDTTISEFVRVLGVVTD